MKSKKKKAYDSTARKLHAAGIQGGMPRRQGDWEKDREQRVPGQPVARKNKGTSSLVVPVSRKTMMEMAHDKASGMMDKQIASKYAVTLSYVQDALRTLYVSNKQGREILKGVILENAISCGMASRECVGKLQPMQKVIATGIFTQRFIDLDKHTQSAAPEVDFQALDRIGKVLDKMNRQVAGMDDDDETEIIDVSVE